jgi:hypothetical protein
MSAATAIAAMADADLLISIAGGDAGAPTAELYDR